MRSSTVAARLSTAAVIAAISCASAAAAQPAAPAPAPSAPSKAPVAPLSETLIGEAKSDYDLGRSLFGNGDYANAFLKFEHAYALSRDARLIWNMVACSSKLHRYKQILSLLEQLKREGSGVLSEEDWAKIAQIERGASALVSHLELTVSEAGAEIFVDDEAIGKAPLAQPALIEAGRRSIRIVKPGFNEVLRVEQVAPGTRVALTVKLEPLVHTGRLSIVADAGARIALDGRVVGEGRWEGAVPSGSHAVRVTAPGKLPYQADVLVQDNQLNRLQIGLTPSGGGSGVPTWAWIAGGAVVAGLVVGGVFLFRPESEAPVVGTLGPTLPTAIGGRW